MQALAKAGAPLQRIKQELGAVECEHGARARVWIAMVGEPRFSACAFVFEDEAGAPRRDARRQGAEILPRLLFESCQRDAFRLGFQYPACLAVDIKEVVGRSGRDGELTDRYAEASTKVDVRAILDDPAGGRKLFINVLAGAGFWQHRGSRG